MKRLIALLLGIVGAAASAQTPVAPISGVAANQYGQPLAGAKIRVCNVTSTGTPCNPTVPIYQDYGLTIPAPNPYSADQYGNYTVYVGTGTPQNLYTVQISAGGGLVFSYVMNGPPSTGTGSVTNFSAGSLTPLFTTSVTNPSTTPTLAFTLTQAADQTFFGNFSGASAVPTYWNLLAGANVTITPNTGARTVTIASTGGGGGANLPSVQQVIAGDGTGNGLGMPEKGTTSSSGSAFVQYDEDVANGRFDCRNPAYAGGCLGSTPGLAMQAFSDRLVCYQSITGKKANTIFPPGIITVGTPTQPTLKLPTGASYQGYGGWGFANMATIFQAHYNNHPAIQFLTNLTSTTACSDGVTHTSSLVGGSYDGFAEHGCGQGSCVNVPGESGSYPFGGAAQSGIGIFDADASVAQKAGVFANNNGGSGITVDSQDSHVFHIGGAANNTYFYFGMDQGGQNYQFSNGECHGEVEVVGLDSMFPGPFETYGAFATPGWEYGHLAGICWGGGITNLGPSFAQLEEIGIIHNTGGNNNAHAETARIDAPMGTGILDQGNGNTTWDNPRVVSPCQIDGSADNLVYSVATASPGSGQTPGTYLLTASSGSAQISVTVTGAGTVTAAPVVTVHGRGYAAGVTPTFTLAAGGTPATFTVSMASVFFVPNGSGLSSHNWCDAIQDRSAGGDAWIRPMLRPSAFFPPIHETGDIWAAVGSGNEGSTFIQPEGTASGLGVVWDNQQFEEPAVELQRIINADRNVTGGGWGGTGTVVDLSATGQHIQLLNTTPTTLTNMPNGYIMEDLWIMGDGNSTMPYISGPNAGQFGAVNCSRGPLLLQANHQYHYVITGGLFFGFPPALTEQCDSINQNYWQMGFDGVFTPPSTVTLSVSDTAGDAAVRSLTQPGSGSITIAGATGSFSYCIATKIWFAGGKAATTPVCSAKTPPVTSTSSNNFQYHLGIPRNWTQYKVYLQSTTDPSFTPGVLTTVTTPTGLPGLPISDIQFFVQQISPSDTSIIPTANLGTKSTGLYHMDATDIPASSTSLGVTGQIQIDPVAGKLWYATAPDTWTSWTLGGGGGGGGTVTGTGTANTLAMWLTSSSLTNSPMSFASGVLTSTAPMAVNDGSGNGGTFGSTEGTDPAAQTGVDQLFGDAATHRFIANMNGGSNVFMVGLTAQGTAGNCPVFASGGYDIVDSGAPCGGTASFTPTKVCGAGCGTGGTSTLSTGANDNNGFLTINTGTSPTGGGAGVVTLTFGGTYGSARKCSVVPVNNNAFGLGVNSLTITIANSTATNFIITPANSVALAASTTYIVFYRCGS